jgi:hypothetical protein
MQGMPTRLRSVIKATMLVRTILLLAKILTSILEKRPPEPVPAPQRAAIPEERCAHDQGNKRQRARVLGIMIFIAIAVASGAYGIGLFRSSPALITPPNVDGGLFLLSEPSSIDTPLSLAVAVTGAGDDHPTVSASVRLGSVLEPEKPMALVVSGDLLPVGPVTLRYFSLSLEKLAEMSSRRGPTDVTAVPASVTYRVIASQNYTLGSLDDVRQGEAAVNIPGITSGAHVIVIPAANSYTLTWKIGKPLARNGRGNWAGAVPPVGTPSSVSVLNSIFHSGEYQPPFPANFLDGSTDPKLSDDVRRIQREHEESLPIIEALDPATRTLEERKAAEQSENPYNGPPFDGFYFDQRLDQRWVAPRKLTTALTVGKLGNGQKLESAAPSVVGRVDELVWLSPNVSGQVPSVSWASSDPSSQQSSSDQILFAGILLGVPIAAILTLLERLIDR